VSGLDARRDHAERRRPADGVVWLEHNAVRLALHPVATGQPGASAVAPLLLLHGLGESAAARHPATAAWPGAVWALDFTGHGRSTVPQGGGYTAEVLMGDADLALAHLGPCTVLGRGLGAYVALLIAGARPHLVRGAVLCDGPGMAGGGVGPTSSAVLTIDDTHARPLEAPDPWALLELSRDVRPPDYATAFARQATQLSSFGYPFAVCARWRPPWLEAVANEPGVLDMTVEEALAFYELGS
jgi:pimeloyl-ACP methyl ester carboxylesterase